MAKPKNKGLGKGLDALLSSTYEESAGESASAPAYEPPAQTAPVHEEKPLQPSPLPEKGNAEKGDVSSRRRVVELDPEEEAEIAASKPEIPHTIPERTVDPQTLPMAEQARPVEKARPIKKSVPASKKIQRPAPEEANIAEESVIIKGVVERVPDELPIDAISPNPNQPRISFKKEELEELAASIMKDGLLQPILVRPIDNTHYQIIAGERRWQACNLAGLKKVPVRIKEASDGEALELALVENIQRSDLNPIEEAYGYRRMMEQGLTQAEVAQQLSKGRSTIANALRLLELPEDAQQLLFEEKITAGHARAILSVPSSEGRQKLTDKLVKEKLSVRQTESLARLMSVKPGEGKTAKREPMPKSFKLVARQLKNKLAAPVRVKNSGGKNRIEIEFADEEDLERIYNAIFNIESAESGEAAGESSEAE